MQTVHRNTADTMKKMDTMKAVNGQHKEKKVNKDEVNGQQSVTWATLDVPAQCRRCTLKLMDELQLRDKYKAVRISVPSDSARVQCPVVIRGPLEDVRVVRGELKLHLGIKEQKQKKQKQLKLMPKPQNLTLGRYVHAAMLKGTTDKQRRKKERRRSQRRRDSDESFS